MRKGLILLIMFIFLCSYVYAALTDDLISYYSFDSQNVVDEHTGAYNGTGYNDSYSTSIVKVGDASFGKNTEGDNYATLPLNFTAITAATISFWYYMDVGTDVNAFIGSQNGDSKPWLTRETIFGNLTRAYWKDSGGTARAVSTDHVQDDKKWYFYTVTVNATGLYFYTNGTYVGTAASGQTWPMVNLYLGTSGYLNQWYNDGYEDELAFWSRDLSAAEITEIYDCGIANTTLLNCGAAPSGAPTILTINCTSCVADATPNVAPYTMTGLYPTFLITMDIAGTAKIYTENQNYSTMPSDTNCNGTGKILACTLNSSGGYRVTDIVQKLYIATAASGEENVTSATPDGLEMDEWSLGIVLSNNMTVSNSSNPVNLDANLTFTDSDYGMFTILTNFTIDGWYLNLSGGMVYKPDGYELYIKD